MTLKTAEPAIVQAIAREPVRCTALSRHWLTPGRFALILAALICAAFPDVIFGAKSFFFRDYSLFGYPLAHYHRENFWHGQVPLWNPLNNCGLPYAAQWNTMVFYPLSLIYLLLPLPWSLGWFCLLHLFLGGMGIYFLALRWTSNPLAAGLAGISFCFSGLAMSFLIWPNNIAAFGWLPWVLLLAQKAWNGGRIDLVKAALAGATQMLSGAPEVILFTWMIAGTIWLSEFIGNDRKTNLVIRGAALIGLVLALSAIQLLPFFDLLSHSQRDGQNIGSQWSMPSWGWANLFVPMFRMTPSAMGVYMQSSQSWASSYYFGVATLMLAITALCHVRKLIVCALGLVLILSLILALGDNGYLYGWLRKATALGFMRFPVKLVVLSAVAVPLLAAFAWSRWQVAHQGKFKRTTLLVFGVFLLVIATTIAVARNQPNKDGSWNTVLLSGGSRAMLLTVFLAICLALARAKNVQARILLEAALLATLWLDLFTHVPRQNPAVEGEAYRMALPSFAQMEPHPAIGKARAALSFHAIEKFYTAMLSNRFESVMGHRMGLYDNCNLVEGIPKVDGFFSLYLPTEQQVRYRLFVSTNELRKGLADFVGIGQVTSDHNIVDWKARPTWMPMITAGQRPIFATDETTLNALMGEFDPRATVYLPSSETSRLPFTNGTAARILSQKVEPHRIEAVVETPERALVVIAQTFYHRWKPTVDGQSAVLLRANHAFQAIAVPAGRHEVRLVYDDPAFRWGAVISAIALLACLGMAIPRRRPHSSPTVD